MTFAARTTLADGRMATITVRPPAPREVRLEFPCFGSTCGAIISGDGPDGPALWAAARVKRQLLGWHRQFSRFEHNSELTALNEDRHRSLAVSSEMGALVQAAIDAAELTGGLVDPTFVGELELLGYATDLQSSLPLRDALAVAPARAPGRPDPRARWRRLEVDAATNTVTRPPGLKLDSGGIAKGLLGDLLATELADYESFAIDAAGDIRFGGGGGLLRPVEVIGPFDDAILHTFELRRGAAATSGIGKRSWLGRDGRPAHHLLDPSTGEPAFTGVVQVTALAPTGIESEARAKASLLSGADGAAGWLPHGGVVVYDDGAVEVVAPAPGLVNA